MYFINISTHIFQCLGRITMFIEVESFLGFVKMLKVNLNHSLLLVKFDTDKPKQLKK